MTREQAEREARSWLMDYFPGIRDDHASLANLILRAHAEGIRAGLEDAHNVLANSGFVFGAMWLRRWIDRQDTLRTPDALAGEPAASPSDRSKDHE